MTSMLVLYRKKFKQVQDKRKTLLHEVEQLLLKACSFSQQQRNDVAEQIASAYIEETGRRPDPFSLYLLGNFILSDYMQDRDPSKRKRLYSFMTPSQEKRARLLGREIPAGDWDITDLPRTGHRRSFFTDNQGSPQETRQAINQYNK